MLRVLIAALVTVTCLSTASSDETAVKVFDKTQLMAFTYIKPVPAPQMSTPLVTKVSVQCGPYTCDTGCCAYKVGNECVHECATHHAPLCPPGNPC